MPFISYRSFPELSFVPTVEAAQFWKRAQQRAKRGWQDWAIPLCLMAFCLFYPSWGRWRGSIVTYWAGVLLFAFLVNTLQLHLIYRRARRLLREELRAAGRCPACGYDLTGNMTGVCPECGGAAAPA